MTSPTAEPARLTAATLEIGPASTQADLVVSLASPAATGPALIEVAIELPPALTLPSTDRLLAVAAMPNLEGEFVGDKFVVLAGDAKNPTAPPLASGPLFRLRLQPTVPRQPGTYTVLLRDLRAATASGDAVAVDVNVIPVEVIVR